MHRTLARNRRVASGIVYTALMTGIAGEQEGQRSHARRNHELLVAAAREVFARARRRGLARGDRPARRRRRRHALPPFRHARCARRGGLRAAHRRVRRASAEAAAEEPDGWLAFVGLLERMLEIQAGDRMLKDVFLRSPPGTRPRRAGARGDAAARSRPSSSARTRRAACAPTSRSPTSRCCSGRSGR